MQSKTCVASPTSPTKLSSRRETSCRKFLCFVFQGNTNTGATIQHLVICQAPAPSANVWRWHYSCCETKPGGWDSIYHCLWLCWAIILYLQFGACLPTMQRELVHSPCLAKHFLQGVKRQHPVMHVSFPQLELLLVLKAIVSNSYKHLEHASCWVLSIKTTMLLAQLRKWVSWLYSQLNPVVYYFIS